MFPQRFALSGRQVSIENRDFIDRPGPKITGEMPSRTDDKWAAIGGCFGQLLFASSYAINKKRDRTLPVVCHRQEGPLIPEPDPPIGRDGSIVVSVIKPSVISDPCRIVVRVGYIDWAFCHQWRPGSTLAIPPQPETERVRSHAIQARTGTDINKAVRLGPMETQRFAAFSSLPGRFTVDRTVVPETRMILDENSLAFIKG